MESVVEHLLFLINRGMQKGNLKEESHGWCGKRAGWEAGLEEDARGPTRGKSTSKSQNVKKSDLNFLIIRGV